MNWHPSSWSDWGALAAILVSISGVFYLALKSRLGVDFVPRKELMGLHTQNLSAIEELHSDHTVLSKRVESVEQRLGSMATRADVQRVEGKVGDMAAAVGKLTGTVESMETGQERIFTQLQMLTRAALPERGGSD